MSWLRGALLAVLTAATAAFGVGFWTFARSVEQAAPRDPLPEADGIVALTGGSTARLTAAMALLREGRGRLVLITGVNRRVRDLELYALLDVRSAEERAALTLGRQAEDTLGNAAETAAWAQTHGVRRLIVVTDDYHMPRALTELRLAMPEVELVAYPVRTEYTRPNVWRRDLTAAGRIGSEYVKYLIIQGRERVMGGVREDDTP